jgi:hypothetical protein
MVPFLAAALAIARGSRNSIAPVKRTTAGYLRKHAGKVVATSGASSFGYHRRMLADRLRQRWKLSKPAAMAAAALNVGRRGRPELAGGRVFDRLSAPWAAYARNLRLSNSATSSHTDVVLKPATRKGMSLWMSAGTRNHGALLYTHRSSRHWIERALAGRNGARFLSDQRSFAPRATSATLQHEFAQTRLPTRANLHDERESGFSEIAMPEEIGYARRSKTAPAVARNEHAREVVEIRRPVTTGFEEAIDDYFWRRLRVPPSGMTGYDSRVSPIWAGLQIPGS